MFTSFNRFELELTEDQARSGSHQGACDEDISYLLTLPEIQAQFEKISVMDIEQELSEYGAWDETELKDHDQNKARILWIACGDIVAELPTPNKIFGNKQTTA
jgi:hypothetical protein